MKTNLISCDKFSRHFSAFLDPFIDSFNLSIALKFFVHIVNEVRSSIEFPPEDAVEMPLTYNPPRLFPAYYFTKSFLQVRLAREFTMDSDHEKSSMWSCTKHYPSISRKGQTMLFLFFCPSHGLCYGFHMANGSEGRKDPSQALYTHLPTAPSIIFYDNAFQLEEYSLIRESGYYKKTRLYHDTFHGYGHKCTDCYSSASIDGNDKCNESICEQFNSFLQNMKASSTHMNQVNFTFFAQFMIDIWNERKKEVFMKKISIAESGGE